MRGREEDEWTGLMLAANAGDNPAYHRLLKAVTPVLRAGARRGLARAGQPVDQSEDIVQDILLAVHLKRHTWDPKAPFAPWLFAIARNKLIDALRRRGRRIFVNIDDFSETLPGDPVEETVPAGEVTAHLSTLPPRCWLCAAAHLHIRRWRVRLQEPCRRGWLRRFMLRIAPTTRHCSSPPGTRLRLLSSPGSARSQGRAF